MITNKCTFTKNKNAHTHTKDVTILKIKSFIKIQTHGKYNLLTKLYAQHSQGGKNPKFEPKHKTTSN